MTDAPIPASWPLSPGAAEDIGPAMPPATASSRPKLKWFDNHRYSSALSPG
jgi:hypothetical protein